MQARVVLQPVGFGQQPSTQIFRLRMASSNNVLNKMAEKTLNRFKDNHKKSEHRAWEKQSRLLKPLGIGRSAASALLRAVGRMEAQRRCLALRICRLGPTARS